MKKACGCCEGVEQVTPVSVANRPGLGALVYRAGTHASFFETMRARLSSHHFAGDARPLHGLTTRETTDAALAFLDAWATIADVLTFYQERVANEGYLRTATERRSVLELARLVGYEPRPGVAASVYLAFTLDDGIEATIPAGSRTKSVPGPGEVAQTFETAEDIYARAEWNTLQPRLARPQAVRPQRFRAGAPLYLKGTSTNLKVNDPLLLDFGADSVLFFRVLKVEPDQANDRTKVEAQFWRLPDAKGFPVVKSSAELPGEPQAFSADSRQPGDAQPFDAAQQIDAVRQIIERHGRAEDFGVNANTQSAQRVLGHLNTLRGELDAGPSADQLLASLEAALRPLREEHRLAVEGNFTKLEPWIASIVSELDEVSQRLATLTADAASTASNDNAVSEDDSESDAAAERAGSPAVAKKAAETGFAPLAAFATPQQSPSPQPALLQLSALIEDLEKPPSVQPSSRQQLGKSLSESFSSTSDALPQLLAAMRPALAPALYNAWGNAPATARTPLSVYALRARASVFGHNAPLRPMDDDKDGRPDRYEEWTLSRDTGAEGTVETFTIGISLTTINEGMTPAIDLSIEISTGETGSLGTATQPRADNTFNIVVPEPFSETVSVTIHGDPDSFPVSVDFQFTKRPVKLRAERIQRGDWVVTTTENNPSMTSVTVLPFNAGATFPAGQGGNAVTIRGELRGAAGGTPTEKPDVVSLDTIYNQVLPGSWAVLERPTPLAGQPTALVITRVALASDASRADYGITVKGTQLQLDEQWIEPDADTFGVIRGTSVFVQSEELELAEEPLDPVVDALCGDRIELDRLVSGLEPGRWLIVTGERTDITPSQPAADGEQQKPAEAVDLSRLLGTAKLPTGERGIEFMRSALMEMGRGGIGFATGAEELIAGGAESPGAGEAVPGVLAAELVMLSGVEQSFDGNVPGDKTHTTLLLARPLAYCYRLDTVRVYGNVARATHGETREEVLGSGDASRPMQSFELKQSPLTYVSAPTPSGVESTLRVRVNQILWHETDTLAVLGPRDRNYATKTDDAGLTTVVFGNGHQGARLPTGNENVTATYRTGIGRGGNVRAEQISIVAAAPTGVSKVVNPLAASGGADRESRDEARRNAPLAVMSLDRLVSVRDYEDFTRTFAGIGKAIAARLSDGRRQVVHLTIAGADDIPIEPDSDLLKNLFEALRKYGDPFQPVQIATRFLKVLFISARVRVHPDYLWEAVEPRVRAALLDRFSFNRRDLGQDVVLSEVIATVQSVEGVVYVDVDALDFVPEDVSAEDLLELSADLRLRQRIPVGLARVDSDETDPSARIRPAQLALLTPLVPDTLNLRELK